MRRMGNGVGDQVDEFAKSPAPLNSELLRKLSPAHYTSDGVLLPPDAAQEHILSYLSAPSPSTATITSLVEFLSTAGAHSLSLQFLSMPDDAAQVAELEGVRTQTLAKLAERTLSDPHMIDFHLAFGYLTALPQKIAFETYKNALPPAYAKKLYDLIHSLSQIGVAAGEHWGNQEAYTAQCRRMSHNSTWWGVLQKYSVPFEPSKFEDEEKTTEYATSLVFPLVTKASLKLSAAQALKLAQSFCESFDINESVALQKQIEHLLKQVSSSLPIDTSALSRALHLLPTATRLTTLRRCVIELESSFKYATAYNSHSTALEYYRLELGELLRECCEDDEVTMHVRPDDPGEKKKQQVREARRAGEERLSSEIITHVHNLCSRRLFLCSHRALRFGRRLSAWTGGATRWRFSSRTPRSRGPRRGFPTTTSSSSSFLRPSSARAAGAP